MKFQSIILVLICAVIYQGSCKKLTVEENKDRLKTCGGRFLPQPSSNEDGVGVKLAETWLVSVEQTTSNMKTPKSTGFPISQRHALTSSRVLVYKDNRQNKWAYNEVTVKNCGNDHHIKVENYIFKDVEVVFKGKTFNITKARIFWACKVEGVYPVMLLELSEPLDLNPSDIPCLADKNFEYQEENWEVIKEAHSYGFENEEMKHRRVTTIFMNEDSDEDRVDISRWAYTTKYEVADDFGGPLVYNSSGKAVVLGVKSTSPNTKKGEGIYFYNMAFLQEAICKYSGVCPPIIPTTTTTTTTTTTVTPPTTSPSTQNPNILESSTQRNTSIPSRILPNPNSNLTDYVETDFEESEKDFKVEVEYVDELDERELEVYFERDKFNRSGRIKKDVNLFLIFVIFGIWRVFWN
ncbi:hypothetical protein B9Z55_012168 [Caenorhabditis nigoni]|uniref:Peptidase S1 domain-containing protein n=1 Tax=Caenorhabditis nigoni TaxID=1611254 RepID=A0A2G5TVY9_9PELO|nr:hypothetical protein B9Z55_012168 [Caenorhabditis nigoni]